MNKKVKNDRSGQQENHSQKTRKVDIPHYSHLDRHGKKGFKGDAQSMPTYIRNTGNLLFARWICGGLK